MSETLYKIIRKGHQYYGYLFRVDGHHLDEGGVVVLDGQARQGDGDWYTTSAYRSELSLFAQF